MLELAVLGLLHDSPMHGYELRKRLTGLLGAFRAFSFGSLYPTLRRLQRAGFIVEENQNLDGEDEPRPSRGKTWARRGRRVYKLTADGKERFAEWVAQTGPEAYDDGGLFGIRLAFFRHTAADVRLRILEGRRRTVERQREGLRAAAARTRERLDRYTLELQRHGLESVDREVRWLSELIDSERRSAAATPDPAPEPTALPEDGPPADPPDPGSGEPGTT